MRIDVIAVGRMKRGAESDLLSGYVDRAAKIGPSLHLKGPNIIELSESRGQTAAIRQSEEASAILKNAGENPRIAILDEGGTDISSQAFADLIRQERDRGTRSLSFALGGPDGHGETVHASAFVSIRLGRMTWPHQIARILLAEQIYRAMTILTGHPYHRS